MLSSHLRTRAQRRPTRLTGPPRFIGVPARTPTPGAPTPTPAPRATTGRGDRTATGASAAPRSPAARRPSCNRPPRPRPDPHRQAQRRQRPRTPQASDRRSAHSVFFNISISPEFACGLAMDRSVIAADARCTWAMRRARQHPMKMVRAPCGVCRPIARCHEHGMDRATRPRRVCAPLDATPPHLNSSKGDP